jgi:uroporphyrinogen-III synthase
VVVYAARARAAWSDDEAKGIAHCDAVLHYSRRGAELAMSLAKAAGIGDRFRASRHVCLSPDVAEPLRTWGVERLAWSATPREEALFAALEASLR